MPTFTNNTAPGNEHAIVAVADNGIGVHGTSKTSTGTGGVSDSGIGVHGVSTAGPGVRGDAENGVGVFGASKTSSGVGGMTEGGIGVHGAAKTGVGVRGDSETWQGVYGHSTGNAGVVGESKDLHGVFGVCHNPNGGGVYGTNDVGGFGVQGESKSGRGVFGYSETGEGIHGDTRSLTAAAIAAFNLNPEGTGAAIFARKEGAAGYAGFFDGRVWIGGELGVGGDIILPNADCAEDFDIGEAVPIEPGSVVIIGSDGALRECTAAYDGCVAGIVSGAGRYKPALVLDRERRKASRQPVALMGKVFCKADAGQGAIAAGDLLTTSPTRGHAMKASDRQRAFGAVIGKALAPLTEGRGLVPVLVSQR